MEMTVKLLFWVSTLALQLDLSLIQGQPSYIPPDDVYDIFRAHIYEDLLTKSRTQTWRGK